MAKPVKVKVRLKAIRHFCVVEGCPVEIVEPLIQGVTQVINRYRCGTHGMEMREQHIMENIK